LKRNIEKVASHVTSIAVALCLTVTLMPFAYADEGANIEPLTQEPNEGVLYAANDGFIEVEPSEDEASGYEEDADDENADENVDENAETDTYPSDDEADEELELLDGEASEAAWGSESDAETFGKNSLEPLGISGAGDTLIKDGVYTIATTLDKKFALGIGNNSAKTGAKIQLKAKKNTLSQKFYFAHIGKNGYTIHVLRSGKYLDVSHSKLVQRPKSASASQTWVASRTKKGSFVFRNKASGKVLSIKGVAAKNEVNIVVQKRPKNTPKNKEQRAAQTFVLKPASAMSPGSYYLTNTALGKRLKANKSFAADEGLVQIGVPKNDNVQKWVFESVGKGYFRIRNVSTNKVLGTKGNSSASGAVVCLQKKSKAATQKWKVFYDGNEGFAIVNACSAVLSVGGTGADDAEGAWIRTANGSAAQKFKLTLVKLSGVRLDVPLVYQFPTAPTGCEIASLTMLLKYAGYKTTLSKSLKEMKYSSSPHEGFVGNPRGWSGQTIYPKPAGKWIKKRLGSYMVLTDSNLEELCSVLCTGKPVMVWLKHPKIGKHCLVLTGFNEKGFYLNDPYGTKDWFCAYKNFDRYWAGYSRMALTY
jgi:uncharacterized protein YvpB